MSLDRTNTSYTGQQIPTMIEKGKINFDSIVQRSYVWDKTRKSNFIASVLMRYPVGVVYAKATYPGEGKYRVVSVLDGQQRLTTLALYRTGKFAIEGIPLVTLFGSTADLEAAKETIPEEQMQELWDMKMFQVTEKDLEAYTLAEDQIGSYVINLNGMKYEQLPRYCQHLFDTFGIAVYVFDNLLPHEEYEMFKRLNAGKPLTAKEKNIANCRDLANIITIGQHEIFDKILTDRAKETKKYVAYIGKTWMMLFDDIDTISFDSSSLNPALEMLVISPEEKQKIMEIYDHFLDAFNTLEERGLAKLVNKARRETHFISLVPFAADPGKLAALIEKFYGAEGGRTSISEKYDAACGAGSARGVNVLTRHEALKEIYEREVETQ